MKRIFLLVLITTLTFTTFTQCNRYFLYESFNASLPTQKGTWVNTSVPYGTTPVRTGTHQLTFNGVNDAIRTPQIANPGVLTFWHRRSSNTTAWTLRIQTSPDGTTWTNRGSVTTPTTAWVQYTLDIGALGLTNVFIRLLDARASGTHERYVEDLGLTSTDASENTLIPFLGACSQTIDSYVYTITDDAGPTAASAGGYTNSVNRTLTFTPADNTKKLELSFTELDLETTYDFLYVYDGANTSAPLLATLNGKTTPSTITATNTTGQLTIQWTSDISNVGAWGGWVGTLQVITPLPVELLHFDATPYTLFNVLEWTTASEHNSDHFIVQRSADGEHWQHIAVKPSAGNSVETIKYTYTDHYTERNLLHYYRLQQVDIDGKMKIYGPIAVHSVLGKHVIKYINLAGQEVPATANGILFEVYEDGTSKKIIR